MRSRLRRARGLLHLVFVVLLLVPLFFHGHRHASDASPASCAICVAAHHTPAVQAPPIAAPVPLACALELTATEGVFTSARVERAHAGRAPPLVSAERTA